MHDFVNDLAPLDISELFSIQKNTTIIQGPQRLAASVLNIRELIIRKNYFSRLDARIWNSIPICLLSIPKYEFKWYTKTATEHFDGSRHQNELRRTKGC